MRPCKIWHSRVPNLEIIERLIEQAVVTQPSSAESAPIYGHKFIGKTIKKPFTVGRSLLSVLLLLDYAFADMPIGEYRSRVHRHISGFDSGINYLFDVCDKHRCQLCAHCFYEIRVYEILQKRYLSLTDAPAYGIG